ncbi:MAG: hypothetical protein OXT63_14235 [Gemmatimonadota bacterium]|nr:hypothetical protein [Gemmatimonadota bacterium]
MPMHETRLVIRAVLGTAVAMATGFMAENLLLAEWPWWGWGLIALTLGILLVFSEILFERKNRRYQKWLTQLFGVKEENHFEKFVTGGGLGGRMGDGLDWTEDQESESSSSQ